MKIVGLITEYNPFHNGHLYHIRKAKELTGADAVLVVMSGNYVQRGAPALMPKHLRARMALHAGADAVLELPVCYASGSAEYFATGAVTLLNSLGCIDSLCFGSECGDIEALTEISHILADEPEEYRAVLQKSLRNGISFPQARQMALSSFASSEILTQPNNILGIEYLKALEETNSPIVPYTITRTGAGYHDKTLVSNHNYSSASAIRESLVTGEDSARREESFPSEILSELEQHVPPYVSRLMKETYQSRYPVCADDFSLLLKYRLLSETSKSLTRYVDFSEDLANRVIRHRNDFLSYEQFCSLLKSKDLTYTRISRALLHVLLDVTKKDMEEYRTNGLCQYARLLGFCTDSSTVLSYMKKNTSVPLVTKLTQTDALTDTGRKMLLSDIHAADIYESVLTEKYKKTFINEYRQQIVVCNKR